MALLKRADVGAFLDLIHSGPGPLMVIFFVAPSVDALGTLKILTSLLTSEFVPFKVEPVTSYEDLKRQGEPLKEPSAASTIVLIESGATVDLMQYLQPPAAVNILVIDSHRPVALENVFDNSQVLILDDGYLQEHQMALREATELLGDNTLDDDHSFDSEDEIENISPSRSGIRRGISKQTLGKANELLVDYYAGSWRACPSSRLALEIADSYNKIDNNMLWLGTLGCLEAYLLENMTEEYYRGDCYEYLRRHCLRLNPPEATQSSSSQFSSGSKESSPVANNSPMRVGRIRTDEEFKFFLLRHWNIQDAMRHSRYVVGNMQTWKDRGRRLLSEFFVAMGISLDACQRDFLVMDSQAKRKFGRQVLKFADQYGLRDIQSPSFSRDFGFDLTLSASDVVYAVMALIEQPHSKVETREVSWWRTNFPGAFSALVDVGQLRPGILTAIKQQKALLHEVHTILNHRLIRYGRTFRYAVLKNRPDLHWLTCPQTLVRLAHFIIDAQRHTRKGKTPLLIAVHQSQSQTFLTVGLHADGSTNNYFGVAFNRASDGIRARVRHDGFDAVIIEVSEEDLKPFIQALQKEL